MQFDKALIDAARSEFFKVYVDTLTNGIFTGSETAYHGDRIRIYISSSDYADEIILMDNESLAAFLAENLD